MLDDVGCHYAFKDKNTGFTHPLPLNEMGMQNFINTAGANTKDLETVILADIQNKEFWAITENYNDKKQGFNQVLTFAKDTDKPQFLRFMGSPNLASKFYAFSNHHNALDDNVPTSITIIPRQAQGTSGDPDFVTGLIAAIRFQKSNPDTE